ncbi:DNA-binding MarR family transcriptional regulator [Weissella uvarum]|uniref:MarR family winged helix-turn-helix transcriptional regulator n=1 Tax=Weissella uvarum TaxID=1479233 RepID=UPI00196157DD|nr:MarR family transcriptional regulator [Weissella uvarum]MBM7617541.1 DNA-binding MarR family transcriptional regulator [Weissella uvarum]MCM0595577.1 MarR family transcriptional regulator [Weissella uvarum]
MEEITKAIGHIYRSLESISNQEFKTMGLANNLYAYLVRIDENPGIIADDLARELRTDKTTVSRGIKKLVERGLVYTVYEENDKKRKHLYVTEQGQASYRVVNAEHIYSERQLLAGLSEEEIGTLKKLLAVVDKNSDEEWKKVKQGYIRPYR